MVTSTAELVSIAAPIIGETGMAYYFTPETLAVGAGHGMDGLVWYIVGRGGPLGDVEGEVVAAAFGYFNPQTIAAAWTAGTAKLPAREAGREYLRCAAEFGRAKLAGIANIDALAGALGKVQAAADPQGLSLYAAHAAEPMVDDAPGRTMQLLSKLRELRGSAHLLSLRALGIEPRTAHFAKRPEMYKMFGWDADNPPHVSDDTRASLAEAEALTSRIVTPAFAVLNDAERDTVASGLRAVRDTLQGPARSTR